MAGKETTSTEPIRDMPDAPAADAPLPEKPPLPPVPSDKIRVESIGALTDGKRHITFRRRDGTTRDHITSDFASFREGLEIDEGSLPDPEPTPAVNSDPG